MRIEEKNNNIKVTVFEVEVDIDGSVGRLLVAVVGNQLERHGANLVGRYDVELLDEQ